MPTPRPAAVAAASAVDRVADALRDALFDGDLAAGTPLREVALAGSLGVSRSTLREALNVLVAEGLAVREPNRGVAVAASDPDSIHDVMRARAVLELVGVRHWPEAGEEARAAVRAALADYADAVAAAMSYQEINARHLAFHRSLVDLAGSRRLTAMAQMLYSELRLALAQVDRIRRNSHAQVEEHASLIELLEGGQVEQCAAALTAHLAEAEAAIVDALSD